MLEIGALVRTSYGTGPHRIEEIHGPCFCNSACEAHYHLTCTHVVSGAGTWLNGYRPDGTSVFNHDTLIFEGLESGATGDLFGVSS